MLTVLYRLEGIDGKNRTLVISYKKSSIPVNFALVNQFQDFIGEIYEIYGTVESLGGRLYCSALLIDIVQGSDMKLIEESILLFNRSVHSEYENIFI